MAHVSASHSDRLASRLLLAQPVLVALSIAALYAYPNPLAWIGAGVLSLSLVAGFARLRGRVVQTPIDAGLLLIAIGTLFGFVVAHNPEAAMLRLTGIAAAIAGYYLIVTFAQTEPRLRLTGLFVVSLLGVGVLVVLALLRGQLPESPVTRSIGPLLAAFGAFPGVSGDALDVNTRFTVHQYGLAHLALVGSAFAVAAIALAPPSRAPRVLAAVALVVLLPLLLAAQARGAFLAVAIAAAGVGLLRSRLALTIPPLAVGLLLLLLARGWVSRSIEIEWLAQRVSYWTRTLGMLGDFPLTGSGLGMRTFAEAFAWYNGLPDPYQVPHTHNIFLQAYAEQGLPALVGLVVVSLGGIVIGWRASRRVSDNVRWVVAGAFGGFVGSIIYGLTDQVPTTNLSLGLVLALLGVVTAADRLSSSSAGSAGVSPAPAGARVAFAMLLLVGVVALTPRWLSGALTNYGASNLMAVALDRSRGADQKQDRLARAQAALDAATRWNPNNVAAIRDLGWTLLFRNDVAGAHAAVLDANRPDLTTFERAQLARLARASGLVEVSVDLLREGGDMAGLHDVATQMWNARRWQEAATAYSALTELEPDNAENVSNAAWAVLNKGGSTEEARALLAEAVARNPGAARRLAQQLVLEGEPCRNDEKRGGGNFDRCAYWFDLATWVDPTYDRPEVEMGSVLFYRGRFDEALTRFSEAGRRDPRNPSTAVQIADTLGKLGRVDDAIASYERAVRARPERADLHVSLAKGLLTASRRDDALRELREAARLAPSNQSIADELSRIQAGGQ